MKTLISVLSASAALGLAAMAPAFAQEPNAEVTTLLGQVAEAYRNLPALSATLEMSQGAGPAARKVTSKFIVKRPNLVNATIVSGTETKHFVADGTNYFVDSSADTKKYIKGSASDFSTSINTLARNGGTGVGLLPILLTSPKAEQQIIPGKPASVKKIADTQVAADSCDTVQAVLGEGDRQSDYTFAFSKSDHLLRKLTIGPHKEGAAPSVTETYSDVNRSPQTNAATFKYVPAKGAVTLE